MGFANFDLSSLSARLLIIAEFLLGLGLISGWWHHLVNSLSLLFILLFSSFLIWRAYLGDTNSCHCFGSIVELNPVESLIKNIICLLILIYTWLFPSPLCLEKEIKILKDKTICINRKTRVCVTIAISTIVAIILFAINLPDFVFRWTRADSSYINNELLIDPRIGIDSTVFQSKKIVCFYSVECEHCRHCAEKMSMIMHNNGLDSDNLYAIFMQIKPEMDELILDFWLETSVEQYTLSDSQSLDFQFTNPYKSQFIHPYNFVAITNGAMPLVCLMEDGVVIKEYDSLTIDETAIVNFFK